MHININVNYSFDPGSPGSPLPAGWRWYRYGRRFWDETTPDGLSRYIVHPAMHPRLVCIDCGNVMASPLSLASHNRRHRVQVPR